MSQTLIISSRLEELEELSLWLQQQLPDTLSESKRNKILLVAQEVATNAILYGNKSVESETVVIKLTRNPTDILLEIEDQGRGLPALPSKEEAQKMDYLEENGRGLKLTVLLSDAAQVTKNKISITFNI